MIKILLWIIAFISIYTIGCVGLEVLPTLGTTENPILINSVLLNLSYSYFAGLIFYLLVTYYPFYLQRKKFSPIIKSKINDLYNQVEATIQTFETKEVKGIVDTITFDELKKVIEKNSMYSNSFYANTVGYQMNNFQFLVETKNNFFTIIERLLIYKDYLSINQIVSIEKIRDSSFFHLTKVYESSSLAILYYNSSQFKEELAKELFNIILYMRKIKG
ncbi:hypothetical protein [Phocaeicola sp.]